MEFAIVFPLLVLVILGTVEAALLMVDYTAGTAATTKGARIAVVIDPVATAAQFAFSSYTTMPGQSGSYCADSSGGASTASSCPAINITCTGDTSAAGGTCTANSGFNKTSFDAIFNAIQTLYIGRKLDRRQVQVSYSTTNLGFVGQQSFDGSNGELPMNVTVQLRCMTHQLFFIAGLVRWTFANLAAGCSGITLGASKGIVMPPFSTTLPSEDLKTN